MVGSAEGRPGIIAASQQIRQRRGCIAASRERGSVLRAGWECTAREAMFAESGDWVGRAMLGPLWERRESR
ncbi:hypothetical protein ASE10_08075 [Lysobacter sp. Root76]|nr:hypothetical protein ASE10_08075 [Lysobacter sp. Root76]KRD70343.1 hypothetical protein ASE45_00240 [Lysobacter sp. Root96]